MRTPPSRLGRVALAAAAVLAVLALLAAGGAGHAPRPALAQGAVAQPGPQATPGGIAVAAEGEATGTPDVAFVDLGVQTEAPTAREAMNQNAAAMAAVIEAVKRAGVAEPDLRTTGLSLTPIRARPQPPRPDEPPDGGPPPIVAYRATNRVHVTVRPVGRAGEVIDAAVQAGANLAGGVGFGLGDDAALRRRALEAAAQAARAEAEALAGALGLRITGVQAVVEEGAGGEPPRPLAVGGAAAEAAAPPIQPGELTVRARVRVVFTFA